MTIKQILLCCVSFHLKTFKNGKYREYQPFFFFYHTFKTLG
ncbi:hypothetical protein L289_3015 [Acinetobacter gerneri DSM 14967 = CIP 107464 = MTCC 9824]|nr:hypothetical protein L289_3015 [Acinetobacter gerneri DSM 14967 = CIP 107464 = MTCC 9824]